MHSRASTNINCSTAPNQDSFDVLNSNYQPPSPDRFSPSPKFSGKAIRSMIHQVWGIEHVRDYHIDAIFLLVFVKTKMMYLVRKRGGDIVSFTQYGHCSSRDKRDCVHGNPDVPFSKGDPLV